MGMDWSLREGYVWAEDKVATEYLRSQDQTRSLFWHGIDSHEM